MVQDCSSEGKCFCGGLNVVSVRTLLRHIGMDLHSTLCSHCEEAIDTIDHSMV